MIDASKTSALIPERPVVLPEGSALGQTIGQVYRRMDEFPSAIFLDEIGTETEPEPKGAKWQRFTN